LNAVDVHVSGPGGGGVDLHAEGRRAHGAKRRRHLEPVVERGEVDERSRQLVSAGVVDQRQLARGRRCEGTGAAHHEDVEREARDIGWGVVANTTQRDSRRRRVGDMELQRVGAVIAHGAGDIPFGCRRHARST